MASAEDYAHWIVANQDKKGTPEFDTVAQAYKVARSQSPAKPAQDPTSLGNLAGAAIEPNISLLSGMVAQPAAGIAGLATAAGNALGLTKQEPAEVVRKVQTSMTYEPKTAGGKNAMQVIGYLPEKLGELGHAAGEKVTDLTGSPELGTAADTTLTVLPSLLGVKTGSLLSNAADSASTGLMRSALKPPISAVLNGSAARAIQTLLDEGINVTPGGASKLSDRVTGVNDRIVDAIAGSNARIPKIGVANRLQDLTNQVERQVNPNADVKAVENAYNEFAQHPLIPGSDLPVQLAQELKQGTYRRLSDKYGELGSADTEAQKGLARGLKEEIAAAVPEVGPLNAEESALLNAKDLLDRRVAVAGNKNPLGGFTPLSPSVKSLAVGMADRSELIKSLAARLLNPGDLSLSDATVAGATAPQTFSDDMQKRKAVIAALMGGR